MLRLFVSGRRIGVLQSETLPLIDGIVELGIGVCHLPAIHKELETLHILGIVRFFLGQRGYLDGMIHDEGRLNQMLFHVFLKEQVQDISLLMSFLKFDLVFFRQFSGLFQCLHLIPVHTGVFLHGVYHGNPFKGFAQIHLDTVVYDFCRTQHFLSHMTIEILRQIHHAVVICVGLVKFHQGKLRIMSGIKTFVAEHTADLVNPFHTAHDQSLQIQFQGNPQLQILIQRIEMRLEGACCRTAGIGHQHGSFHFHKALAVQVFPDGADDFGPFDKGILYLRIHDQIHISLTVAQIRIGQTVILFRKDLQAFGQQRHFGGVDGDFSCLGLKHFAPDADDIADIHLFEILIGLFADAVSGHI